MMLQAEVMEAGLQADHVRALHRGLTQARKYHAHVGAITKRNKHKEKTQ